jgi:hypothetical protein
MNWQKTLASAGFLPWQVTVWGGRTAMAFAMSWPEKLYGLIIGDITPLFPMKNFRGVLSP